MDALGGGVAVVGGSSGLLLGGLSLGEGSLASSGVGIREALLLGVGVAARLLGGVDDGGGGSPDHTASAGARGGSGRARGKSPGLVIP